MDMIVIITWFALSVLVGAVAMANNRSFWAYFIFID